MWEFIIHRHGPIIRNWIPQLIIVHTNCFSPLAEQVENLSFSELVKTNVKMNRTQTCMWGTCTPPSVDLAGGKPRLDLSSTKLCPFQV